MTKVKVNILIQYSYKAPPMNYRTQQSRQERGCGLVSKPFALKSKRSEFETQNSFLKKKTPNMGVLACNPRAEKWRQANSWDLTGQPAWLCISSIRPERNPVSKNQMVPCRMAAEAVL